MILYVWLGPPTTQKHEKGSDPFYLTPFISFYLRFYLRCWEHLRYGLFIPRIAKIFLIRYLLFPDYVLTV